MATKTAPKKAPKKKKPIMTERILARHDFTPAEMASLGAESGRLTNEINGLRDDAKGVANDFKAKIELKEAARNAQATKLANGYEMREVTAAVIYDTKKREKRFVDPKNKTHVFKTEAMTEADWQLPMFKREEIVSKKPEPKKDGEKPGTTNVGTKLDDAIMEAGQAQERVDFDLDEAIESGLAGKKLVAPWRKAAKKAGWPDKVIKPIAAFAEGKHEEGSGAVADVLRPFSIQK